VTVNTTKREITTMSAHGNACSYIALIWQQALMSYLSYSSHFPASHENLGEADILQGLEHLKLIDEASMSIVVPMDSSGGSSWPKILNKELEVRQVVYFTVSGIIC